MQQVLTFDIHSALLKRQHIWWIKSTYLQLEVIKQLLNEAFLYAWYPPKESNDTLWNNSTSPDGFFFVCVCFLIGFNTVTDN